MEQQISNNEILFLICISDEDDIAERKQSMTDLAGR